MDNEVLVEFYKIIRTLKQDGYLALFMLKAVDTDIQNWNLIVSTSVYDNLTTKQALKFGQHTE